MEHSSESIFKNYWNEVVNILGDDPNRSTAYCLNEYPSNNCDGPAIIQQLYDSLNCDGWDLKHGKNWVWRSEAPSHETSKAEVSLEREIVLADIGQNWTCQMSTASGIQGPKKCKRCAIDLVTRRAPDEYAFIELKVDSNNPLYAVFEILGYTLAYYQARQQGWNGTGRYDVMTAQVINLVVLGPRRWYEYKHRGKNAEIHVFDLTWLAQLLTDGLNHLTGGQPSMSFSFEEFVDYDDPKSTAAGIIRDAKQW